MKQIIILCLLLNVTGLGLAYAAGSYPVPQITDVSFSAQAQYDPATFRFTYRYRIASGSGNQGNIGSFYIDIKRSGFQPSTPPADFYFSVPIGQIPTSEEIEFYDRYKKLPYNTTIETVRTDLPQYWSTGIARDGYLGIKSPAGGVLDENGVATSGDRISPGEVAENLTVVALSPPTLREVIIMPDWRFVVENEGAVTPELRQQADQIKKNLPIKMVTIGPEAVSDAGSHQFHRRMVKDIDQMVVLGWINDIALIDSIQALLTEALVFMLKADGTQAKVKYQQALDLMTPVTESQMRREAIDLIVINLQLRLQFVPDTTVTNEYDMIIAPEEVDLEPGQTVSIIPTIIDRALDNEVIPEPGASFALEVLSGPHAGLRIPPGGFFGGTTWDSLNYSGIATGSDIVEITFLGSEALPVARFNQQAKINWIGGPDYVISNFSPPFLEYRGDATIWVQDYTKNIGKTAGSLSSITRYYLSDTPDFDIDSAFPLTQREVVPLDVGIENASGATELIWPGQFPPGTYFFAACVDADNQIAELNENNNCSFHRVDQVNYKVAMMGEEPFDLNVPPNCDQAIAFPDTLWPPNHKFKSVAIEGVIDVDQDDVIINITGITQDEPVDGESSGHTSPDATGVGNSAALLRAERDGTGDGRVYAIQFKATDSAGNECSGEVVASSVVHDQSGRSLSPIDNGQVYDSTQQY